MSQIEPRPVVDAVEEYISRELRDVELYENRDLMDEGGIYALHSLAAEIYAKGYADGVLTAQLREDRIRRRWQELERRTCAESP